MKLQLALDGEFDQSLAVLEAVNAWVDIVEIGTPLIYREGMRAVRHIHEAFPAMSLLADLKIMDAGGEEAAIAFAAGCDLVTILGVTQDSTIRAAAATARRYEKQVVADLMQVSDGVSRGRDLLSLGCDVLCVHTAYDSQAAGNTPLEALQRVRRALPEARLAVAGGIDLSTLADIAALQPEIVIVGGAITRADDPARAARDLYERMRDLE